MTTPSILPTTDGAFTMHEPVEAPPGSFRVMLAGRVDIDGAAKLVEALQSLLDRGARRVELDFGAVDFLSSSGIGGLIVSVGEYRDAQADVVLVNLSAPLRAVFETLDLLDYVTIED